MYLRRLALVSILPLLVNAQVCESHKNELLNFKSELTKKYDYKKLSAIDFNVLKSDFASLKTKAESLRVCQKNNNQFMDTCRFKLNLLENEYETTQVVYSEAAMLDDGYQSSCNFYSTKKFKYYVNSQTKKILLTDINGLLGLRSYLDCRLDAEVETNRRINFSKKRSGEKYSKFTVIDDWLYPDSRPDQYGEYPLGIQVLSQDKIDITIKEDLIRVSLGKYYVDLETQVGKIVNSNFLDSNFYDNGRCHTNIDNRTQKLIPDFDFKDGISLRTKIISY